MTSYKSELVINTNANLKCRRANEDTHHVSNFGNFGRILAIYDGHGGIDCANALSQLFHVYILKHLDKIEQLKKASRLTPYLIDQIRQNIKDAFKECDEYLHENKVKAGSTAIIVIELLDYLFFCNLGDSRAVFFDKDYKPIFETRDQKPSDELEQERIKQCGGYVNTFGNVARVNGSLAVARAFGNFDYFSGFKYNSNGYTAFDGPVSARPEIDAVPKQDGYLILACDGLWDVVTNQEVAHLVQQGGINLADYAVTKGSQDNVTVITTKISV